MFQHASRLHARVSSRVILTVRTSFSIFTLVLIVFTNPGLCGTSNSQAVSSSNRHAAPNQGAWISMVQTNQARYLPGDSVRFSITFSSLTADAQLKVTYRHLNNVIGDYALSLSETDSFSWVWPTPSEDFRGYLIEIILLNGGTEADRATIAVDVSSSWRRFPR